MPSLWFCVPSFGRAELARICLSQLRLTCEALCENGVEATAVVVADDENLDTARELGFGTVRRDNRFLGQRFNDAIQLACDPAYNPRPADFVVPCGSDDWIDWRLFLDLPGPDGMHGFQRISFVREDGCEISSRFLNYVGGCGIRVYPRQVMARLGYRPADEDRPRACDTSILTNLRRVFPELRIWHCPSDPRQIVDWKSSGVQLNSYRDISHRYRGDISDDPFTALADWFPAESLDAMAAHYGRVAVAA